MTRRDYDPIRCINCDFQSDNEDDFVWHGAEPDVNWHGDAYCMECDVSLFGDPFDAGGDDG